ncbi:MAG: SRPBCC family protein [Gaiellaceae bacterium]
MSTMTAQTTQVYSVFIKASPEQVWDAITKPEFTSKYFYGSVIESTYEPGASYRGFSADHSQAYMEGEIVEAIAPSRLVTTWRALWAPDLAEEPFSRVTWEIAPADGGVTQLTIVHDELERSPKTAESVAGGWSFVLSGMKTLLETGKPLAG